MSSVFPNAINYFLPGRVIFFSILVEKKIENERSWNKLAVSKFNTANFLLNYNSKFNS